MMIGGVGRVWGGRRCQAGRGGKVLRWWGRGGRSGLGWPRVWEGCDLMKSAGSARSGGSVGPGGSKVGGVREIGVIRGISFSEGRFAFSVRLLGRVEKTVGARSFSGGWIGGFREVARGAG